MASDDEQVVKNERVRKVIGDILDLDASARIRVLGYLVARAEVEGWLEYLEQEITRTREAV
jgi:hypothetical protein